MESQKRDKVRGDIDQYCPHVENLIDQKKYDQQRASHQPAQPADQEQPTTEEPESEGTSHAPPARASKSTAEATLPRTPISKDEFSAFTNVELKLLDNSNYFKAIFG